MLLKLPRLAAATACLALLLPGTLRAQAHTYAPAPAIEPVIHELGAMRPMADSSFAVWHLRIPHDAAIITLDSGRVWPLTRVNGRIIGVVFKGHGTLDFAAPTPVERERLTFYLNKPELHEPITSAVMLFTDPTLQLLEGGQVTFEHEGAPGVLDDQLDQARDYLKTFKDRTWDPTLLEPVLNGRENGMFFALVQRAHGEDLVLEVDPDDPEPIHLGVRDRAPGSDVDPEWVAQFARTDQPPPARDQRRRQVSVDKYVLDVNMPQALDGGVSFAAQSQATLRVPTGGYGPWVPFYLFPYLDVDSARWEGTPAPVYKNNDAYYMWVRAPDRLVEGTTPAFTVWYHGDLLARHGDWFTLKDPSGWYPRPVDAMAKASFDITYHTPIGLPIGSVGTQTDTSTSGRMVTSHWIHEAPIRNAGFNIGRFERYDLESPGTPPITLLWSDAGHRAMARDLGVAPQAHVRETITDEAASALRFFTTEFGPPQEQHFFATEIPDLHGEAFPGLIHYSYFTFLPTGSIPSDSGEGFSKLPGWDQLFRAHELAHQWWGIGVDYASYRDRWLSEGLAEFSGLWYLQVRSGSLDKYLGFLREYRTNLIAARGRLGATSLGDRAADGRDPQYYEYAVYQKGAWAMHMLRILMLQMSTMNEDRFSNAMKEFHTQHRGGSASTEDLRAEMERASGANLKWFFDEWIDGTAIPTYDWAWKAGTGANGQPALQIRVRQSNVPDDFQMYVPIAVELKDGRTLRTRVHVTGPLTETQIPVPAEVKSVRFNEFEGVLAEVRSVSY